MSRGFVLAVALAAAGPAAPREMSTITVGNCAPSLSAGQAPFAVAIKKGWFERDGI